MCGIAALFAGPNSKVALPQMRAMTDLVRHRGPDDVGYALFREKGSPLVIGDQDTPASVFNAPYAYCPKREEAADVTGDALLGHRRLSIIDLSPGGHQPMCSDNGRYWISYNGEVYNYLELKAELEKAGHRFTSQSDTEVILKAYQLEGERCLARFNGMFAFIIYDTIERQVFAARDRFGVKPLYFWQSPQGMLAIASEIKQFSCLPGWQAATNDQRVYDYLVGGATDHTRETLFAGVHQLRGGECLHFTLATGTLRTHPWYILPHGEFSGTEQEAGEQFRVLLSDSVRLRLRSDVDVGFCLSGGLDSSSIVCLAHRHLNAQQATHRQKTFSACAHEKAYDERHFMQLINQHCGLDAHYIYPSLEQLFDEAAAITWHQDEPFGSTSIYAQWRVFELARQNSVKVMLDGQGADEQLAGYFGFFKHRLAELFFRGRWVRFFQEVGHIRRQHGVSVIPKAAKAFRQTLKYALRGHRMRHGAASTWLDLDRLKATDHLSYGSHTHEPVREQCVRQLTDHLPALLRYEDRNSMAHSIESRTPFLDYRLVEFVNTLPGHFRISHGVTKRVLREGMRGILPDEVRLRMDKLGFATPEEVWIKQHQPQRFLQQIDKAYEQAQGILKPEVKQMAARVVSGEKPFSFFLWRIINFGLWMECHQVR